MHGKQEYSETFDETTFQISLRASDPAIRRAAVNVRGKLERLARMRARNENITFDDAWAHIFDIGRMRGDLQWADDRRAALASVIWDELGNLVDLREDLAERLAVANARARKGGVRAA